MWQRFDVLSDNMDYGGFMLEFSRYHQCGLQVDHQPLLLEEFRPDDDVGRSRFVFEGDKHDSACGAWALTTGHRSGYRHSRSIGKVSQFRCCPYVVKLIPNQFHWVGARREFEVR